MSNILVTVNLVVLNGGKYIRHCLDAILTQTYPHELIEFNILDNGSTDGTIDKIKETMSNEQRAWLSKFFLLENKKNLGMWPGQEELLKHSSGKYVLAMAVDVILDKDFIKNAVGAMEKDNKIGALEAKIYKYDIQKLEIGNWKLEIGGTLDTCGFKIFKSRRLINIGHGEKDKGRYDGLGEIFGVEGAAPFFRREALESCRINGQIIDHDYFWYGDDLDLAWRMRMFGWKEIFAPNVIAWHDRQTTKNLRKSRTDFIKLRRAIPMKKRWLDWRNTRFTIVKNDYTINLFKDLPYILKREVLMSVYILFFEPKLLLKIPNFLKLLPKMLRRRKEIMKKAVIKPQEIEKWFQ